MELGNNCDMTLDGLPEGCISHILSLTTPKDTCVCAAVSTGFHSAAVSDYVWNQFLPSDYQDIMSRAVHPVQFSSKKDLFSKLCRPLLIDEGKVSFMLEKSTGYKCFMLSAEKLRIAYGDTREYWRWHPLPQSRFSKVAQLMGWVWLSVSGTVRSGELQANTIYAAYLIYTFCSNSFGFSKRHQESIVKIGDAVICDEILCLKHRSRVITRRCNIRRTFPIILRTEICSPSIEEAKYFPKDRGDGWKEIQLGEFLNEYGVEQEIEIFFRDVESHHWKMGLIIEGIEFRPKK